MVSGTSHPPRGKSLSSLGASSTQSPRVPTPSTIVSSDPSLNSNEVIHNLVESIEARNQMVRKLNESKRYHRADWNYIEMVSDDEVEVELPNINAFIPLMLT